MTVSEGDEVELRLELTQEAPLALVATEALAQEQRVLDRDRGALGVPGRRSGRRLRSRWGRLPRGGREPLQRRRGVFQPLGERLPLAARPLRLGGLTQRVQGASQVGVAADLEIGVARDRAAEVRQRLVSAPGDRERAPQRARLEVEGRPQLGDLFREGQRGGHVSALERQLARLDAQRGVARVLGHQGIERGARRVHVAAGRHHQRSPPQALHARGVPGQALRQLRVGVVEALPTQREAGQIEVQLGEPVPVGLDRGSPGALRVVEATDRLVEVAEAVQAVHRIGGAREVVEDDLLGLLEAERHAERVRVVVCAVAIAGRLFVGPREQRQRLVEVAALVQQTPEVLAGPAVLWAGVDRAAQPALPALRVAERALDDQPHAQERVRVGAQTRGLVEQRAGGVGLALAGELPRALATQVGALGDEPALAQPRRRLSHELEALRVLAPRVEDGGELDDGGLVVGEAPHRLAPEGQGRLERASLAQHGGHAGERSRVGLHAQGAQHPALGRLHPAQPLRLQRGVVRVAPPGSEPEQARVDLDRAAPRLGGPERAEVPRERRRGVHVSRDAVSCEEGVVARLERVQIGSRHASFMDGIRAVEARRPQANGGRTGKILPISPTPWGRERETGDARLTC